MKKYFAFKYYPLMECLILLGILSAAFLINLEKTAFTPDEDTWINKSSHFEDFLKGQFSAFTPKTPLDTFFALTMPTIPEYVIGLGRRVGGYNAAQVKKIELWEWKKTFAENKAKGRIPSSNLLWWSRLLPSLLSVLTILITFYLIKSAFNMYAGYVWIILTLMNPWLIYLLQRAMGESPLLFCIVMTMLMGFLALKSFKDDAKCMRYSLLWLIIFGIFAGLAGQSKTNGLLTFPAGCTILLLLTICAQQNLRWQFFGAGLAGLTIATCLFFIGPNPFLWDDPVEKTIQTILYRIKVMTLLTTQVHPQLAIKGWNEGIQIVLEQIFANLTSIQFANAAYFKMALAGAGAIVLFSKVQQSFTSKFETMNASALSMLIIGSFVSIPSLFSPINIDRYYLLPAYFVSILIAVGFHWLLEYAMNIKMVLTKIHARQQEI